MANKLFPPGDTNYEAKGYEASPWTEFKMGLKALAWAVLGDGAYRLVVFGLGSWRLLNSPRKRKLQRPPQFNVTLF